MCKKDKANNRRFNIEFLVDSNQIIFRDDENNEIVFDSDIPVEIEYYKAKNNIDHIDQLVYHG